MSRPAIPRADVAVVARSRPLALGREQALRAEHQHQDDDQRRDHALPAGGHEEDRVGFDDAQNKAAGDRAQDAAEPPRITTAKLFSTG